MTAVRVSVDPESLSGELSGKQILRLSLRLLLGLALLLLAVMALASAYREELRSLGEWFVARFGYFGMALGTFIADGFHFPIPPQFYMLVAISGGVSQLAAMLAITAGSLLGGFTGYKFAGRLARFSFVAKRLHKSRRFVDVAFARWGYRSALVASVMPIAYSVLCYLSGVYRLPPKLFAVLCLCRIPRLIVFYYLVKLGWVAS